MDRLIELVSTLKSEKNAYSLHLQRLLNLLRAHNIVIPKDMSGQLSITSHSQHLQTSPQNAATENHAENHDVTAQIGDVTIDQHADVTMDHNADIGGVTTDHHTRFSDVIAGHDAESSDVTAEHHAETSDVSANMADCTTRSALVVQSATKTQQQYTLAMSYSSSEQGSTLR